MNGVLGQAGKVWIRAGKVILATAACIARCCGGGGGERYKIYLHRYCTRRECKNFIYVWSDEIAYGDVLWKDTSGWFKIGGVCYYTINFEVCSCEEEGPTCCDSIPAGGQADGPPLTGNIEDHCGPCCGEFGDQDLCRVSSFWSCAEQKWKCFECGEEDDTYVRGTNKVTQTLTPEYIANQDALFAGDPNYRSCWNNGLILDLRESILFRIENRLVADADGCKSLVGTCRQGDYAWRQGQWFWWNFGNPPSCLWQVDEGGEDRCYARDFISQCGLDINPFTGGAIDNFTCSFTDSGTDLSGNHWTRVYQSYSDGRIRSIADTITTTYMTQDRFGNTIPGTIEVREFTYIRQTTVTTPCDGDTRRGCGVRAVCADRPDRPPPAPLPAYTPPKNPRKPGPSKFKLGRRATNPLYSPPISTGSMF